MFRYRQIYTALRLNVSYLTSRDKETFEVSTGVFLNVLLYGSTGVLLLVIGNWGKHTTESVTGHDMQ